MIQLNRIRELLLCAVLVWQCGEAIADEVKTLPLAQAGAGQQLKHPGFLARNAHLLFVGGNESDDIGIVDTRRGALVRVLKLPLPVQPQRLAMTTEGILIAGGAKFVTAVDTRPLLSNIDAEPAFAHYCLFPCGSPTTSAAHGAVDFSITTVSPSAEGSSVLIGIVDRRIKKGALVSIDLKVDDKFRSGFYQGAFERIEPNGERVFHAINPQERVPKPNLVLKKIRDLDDPDGAVFLDDQRTALIVNQATSELLFLNLITGEITARVGTGIPGLRNPFNFIPHVGDSIDVQLSLDQKRAFVSNIRSNTIAVVDVAKREVVRIVRLPGEVGGPYGLSISPNGRYLLTSTWGAPYAYVIDLATLDIVRRVQIGNGAISTVTASRSSIAVSNSNDDSLSIISLSDITLE